MKKSLILVFCSWYFECERLLPIKTRVVQFVQAMFCYSSTGHWRSTQFLCGPKNLFLHSWRLKLDNFFKRLPLQTQKIWNSISVGGPNLKPHRATLVGPWAICCLLFVTGLRVLKSPQNFHFSNFRPSSHEPLWHPILRYCDKNTCIKKRLVATSRLRMRLPQCGTFSAFENATQCVLSD